MPTEYGIYSRMNENGEIYVVDFDKTDTSVFPFLIKEFISLSLPDKNVYEHCDSDINV